MASPGHHLVIASHKDQCKATGITATTATTTGITAATTSTITATTATTITVTGIYAATITGISSTADITGHLTAWHHQILGIRVKCE